MSWENPLPCVSLRYTYHCISIRSTKFTSNIDQRLVPPCVWYACVCLHGRRAEFARVLISAIQYSMYGILYAFGGDDDDEEYSPIALDTYATELKYIAHTHTRR